MLKDLFWQFIKWFLGPLAGLIMFLAGVGPKDAALHLSEWAKWIGIDNIPSWMSQRSTDTTVFLVGLMGFIGWILFLLRPRISILLTGTKWDFSDCLESGIHSGRPLIYGFAASAKNIRKRPLDNVSGSVRSLVTGERYEMFLNVNGIPTKITDTYGIPPKAEFRIYVPFHHVPHPVPSDAVYMPLQTFEREMREFEFEFQHNGITFRKRFLRKDTQAVVDRLNKLLVGDDRPRVSVRRTH